MALPARASAATQRRDDLGRQKGLIAEDDQRGFRLRGQRADTHPRSSWPGRPREHGLTASVTASPASAAVNARCSRPGHHDDWIRAGGQHALDGQPDHGLAMEREEELRLTHPA